MKRSNLVGRSDQDLWAQVGEVPRLAQVELPIDTSQIAAGQGGRTTKSAGRLNLRAVADVLEGYGLDPIEEVAKVLTGRKQLRDKQGKVVIDEATGQPVTEPLVDGDVRLRTLLELAQYSRPKLKAVEVTNKGPELTDEQIDARLKALMDREGKR